MHSPSVLNPIDTYKPILEILPQTLGRTELMVLYVLAYWNGKIESRELYRTLCNYSRQFGEKDKCVASVQNAVKSLKRKNLVTRRKKEGRYVLYLTVRGKQFASFFYNPVMY